ncbi:hypothetical protein FFLO_04329 [Filobasidium floriforme]|uniref:PXA domain-containing protein n=1 Tax=Filobasidium floriforme TaxID=5210 RepID=A0A8K0JJ71_9TREE|nr:hypothetical protein FFLO_04329 [Filobasidium floriforme]
MTTSTTPRKPAYFRRSSAPIIPSSAINDTTTPRDDLEESLHDLLETALQCYVNSWYPSISPRDKSFLPHIYHLLVRVLRSLSTNISAVCESGRLDELVLADLPDIISEHVKNWTRAEQDIVEGGLDQTLAARFALLHGHPAVQLVQSKPTSTRKDTSHRASTDVTQLPSDIDQSLGEAMSSSLHGHDDHPYLRQHQTPLDSVQPPQLPPAYRISPSYLSTLSERLLRCHLPPADYAPLTERTILTEIIASAILANVLQKLSQGWMINRMALSILGEPGRGRQQQRQQVQEKTSQEGADGASKPGSGLVQTVVLIVYQFAAVLLTISQCYTSLQSQWRSLTNDPSTEASDKAGATSHERWKAGVENALDPSLNLLDSLLNLQDGASRKRSIAELRSWVGMACGPIALGRFADKLLPLYLHEHVFRPAVLARGIKTLHEVLFPNGELAPSVPDPTEEEARDLSDRLVARLLEVIPPHARRLIIGPDATHEQAIRRLIAPFQDPDINLHLFTRLLKRILLTIEPRLANDDNDDQLR